MSKKHEMDMTSGPILGKLLIFAAPIVLSNVLQLLYNAADTVIVGRFDGSMAQAAVGATASPIALLTNLFVGLSVGVSVVVAQHFGAYEEKNVFEAVQTSMLASVICGVIVSVLGLAASKPMLVMMGTPAEVLDMSVLYIRLYFIGIPATMVYNFGAAIHRAVGDTRRPLYFLFFAGIINVGLNILLVAVCKMSVAGVAIATFVSQTISAVLITISLCSANGCYRFSIKHMRIYRDKLINILKIGLPVGLQNSLFSISNVIIQSSINSFGALAIAAHTAAVGIEGFINVAVGGIADAATNCTGQNYGAKKYDRIRRICGICCAAAFVLALTLGLLMLRFGRQLLSIYNTDPQVIELGMNRMRIVGVTFWTFALMQIFAGCLRGIGHSNEPMIASLIGICVLRIIYVYTIFPRYPTLYSLYISYPVSWVVALVLNIGCYFVIIRKVLRGEKTADLQ